MKRPHFRFEDIEIWQLPKELSVHFHKVADKLEQCKLYRYAEQLRATGLSVPNNIAEGSGSLHAKKFQQFLNIAKGSISKLDTQLELAYRLKYMNKKNRYGVHSAFCVYASYQVVCCVICRKGVGYVDFMSMFDGNNIVLQSDSSAFADAVCLH